MSANSVFFLSYDETNAEENWLALRRKIPRAQRIHGISGILDAHRLCAEQSSTQMFFLVDGDNEVLDTFDFSFTAEPSDQSAIHVWRCRNAVNDLVYGYGAVKLFPRKSFASVRFTIDLATSVAKQYKIQPVMASITRFNTSPFHAWRAAFRECVKLASESIANQQPAETLARLEAWCTLGRERPYGDWCLAGAVAGRDFGRNFREDKKSLALINDFSWLKSQFESREYGPAALRA